MRNPLKGIRRVHSRIVLLRGLRNWCTALGVVVLALGLMALRNTVGNPETWASAFNAMAANGAFIQHAGWFAAVGGLLLFIALIVGRYLGKIER